MRNRLASWGRFSWSIITVATCLATMAWVPKQAYSQSRGDPWVRHVIDDSSKGADGVRLDDVNGDSLMDIAVGWEEGSAVRAYVNPDVDVVTSPWPAVTVGTAADVEDAVFVDLDGDGAMDVVSCSEGSTEIVRVHWAPNDPADYLDPGQWSSADIPSSSGEPWMFAVPMQIDGLYGIDLVAGGKWGSKIGWFESPASDPRNLSQWSFHEMGGVGWTMSLIDHDMDNDGDLDVVVTDRFNDVGLQGARWLENPGTGLPAQMNPWTNHFIGAQGQDAMLSVIADLDEDGLDDLIVPIMYSANLSFFRRTHPVNNTWETYPIAVPPNVGTPKAVNVGDIDMDDDPDIVFAFANVPAADSGVLWMSYISAPTDPVWEDHEISGSEGIKYDIVALLDLDGDEDLDVITTEEKTNTDGLGVIWYENPTVDWIPGDFDRDRDVDQEDFGHLQACLDVSGASPIDPNCRIADLDTDDDVDQADLDLFRQCLTGANVEADPDCAR